MTTRATRCIAVLALGAALLAGTAGSARAAEAASKSQIEEIKKARQLRDQGAYAQAKRMLEVLKASGADFGKETSLDAEIGACNRALVAFIKAQESAEMEAVRTAAVRARQRDAAMANLDAMRKEAARLKEKEQYDQATELFNRVSKTYVEMRIDEALELVGRGRHDEAKDILEKAQAQLKQYELKIDPARQGKMAATLAQMGVLVENRKEALRFLGVAEVAGPSSGFLAGEYFDRGKAALEQNDPERAKHWLDQAGRYQDFLPKPKRDELPGLLIRVGALKDKETDEARKQFDAAQAKQNLLERAEAWNRELARNDKIRQDRQRQMAEDSYQMAVKAYDNYKLNEALKLADDALSFDPMHQKAANLRARIEGELGKGPRLPEWSKELTNERAVRIGMAEAMLAASLQQAYELLSKGQYEDAVAKYIEAQSLVRYLKGTRELTAEENRIQENLAEAQKKLAEQKQQEERSKAIQSHEEVAKNIRIMEVAERRERASFLRMAYEEYTRGKYKSCIEMCEKIDQIDPGNQAAKELRSNAVKAQRTRDWQVLQEENREARRREVLSLKEKLLWQDAIAKYPSREVWQEIIRRGPVPLPSGEATTTPADLDLEQALEKEVEFSFDGTPLKDVVDFLRQVVQKNMVLDEAAIAEDERLVTMSLSKVPLKSALNLILKQDMGYIIREGAIYISTKDRLRLVEPMDFRIYDIRDLTQSIAARGGTRSSGTTDTSGGTSTTGGTSSLRGTSTGGGTSGGTTTSAQSSGSTGVVSLIQLLTDPQNWSSVSVVGGATTGQEGDTSGGATSGIRTLTGGGGTGEEGAPLGAAGGGTMVLREPGDLLVNQTKRIHSKIEDILTKLREQIDVQVSIEARIVNFTDDFYREVGTNWSNITWNSREYDLGLFTFPKTSWSITQITPSSSVPSGQLDILPTFQMSAQFLDHGQAAAFMRAVKASIYAQVMQAPAITLINTNNGIISVVKNQAYVASYTIGEAGAAAPTISTFTTGVQLDVIPVVSADRRYVELDLVPDISTGELQSFSFSTASIGGNNNGATVVTTQIQQPVEDQQTVQTVVRVPDRGTLIIGGLSKAADYRQESGLPFLSNMPFLKRLFTRMAEYKQRQHLLMLVTPTILIQQEQEDRIPH